MPDLRLCLVYLGLGLLTTGCLSRQPLPPLPVPATAAEHFARRLHIDTLAVLYEAGCIDPATRREDSHRLGRKRQRQRELEDWFHRAGRPSSLDACQTPEDQANLHAYPQAMASAAFIRLSLRQRLAYINRLDRYFHHLQLRLDRSFHDLTEGDAQLLGYLTERCRRHPQIGILTFGRGPTSTTGASYHPGTQRLYLNLNHLVHDPAAFTDSLEHELWHHLLPIVSTRHLGQLPWVEGYTEAVAEFWASSCFPERKATIHRIDYPIQTAFASLHLAYARVPVLRYLAGLDDTASFTRALEQTPLAPALPDVLPQLPPSQPSLQADLTRLLQARGWREDDGRPLDISRLFRDNTLQPAAVSAEFQADGPFVMDLIHVVTLLKLQTIRDRLPQSPTLPDHLLENLRGALRQSQNPTDSF